MNSLRSEQQVKGMPFRSTKPRHGAESDDFNDKRNDAKATTGVTMTKSQIVRLNVGGHIRQFWVQWADCIAGPGHEFQETKELPTNHHTQVESTRHDSRAGTTAPQPDSIVWNNTHGALFESDEDG